MSNQEAFVYCWTDRKTNMLYVGCHKGQQDDGYVCSSKWVLEEYNKRPEDFTRQIIAEGTQDDCLMLETSILKSVDAKHNPEYYNQHNGDGKFILKKGHTKKPWSQERREEFSKTRKSKESVEKWRKSYSSYKPTQETLQKQKENTPRGEKHWMYGNHVQLPNFSFAGHHHTEESRKDMSQKRQGAGNPNYGKKHIFIQESRDRMSKSHIGKTTWMKGKHHNPDSIQKISKKLKGRKIPPEVIQKRIETRKRNKELKIQAMKAFTNEQ